MKKTLAIAALLGALYTTVPASGAEHWADGVTGWRLDNRIANGAYTSYKHNSVTGAAAEGDTPDHLMCWAAAASNLIAWWQDRVKENGALILPDEAPRGHDVWEAVRTYWTNTGGWAPGVIQHWMHGNNISCGYQTRTQAGADFEGYYDRVSGAEFGISNYHASHDFLPEGGLVGTFYVSGRNQHTFEDAMRWLADGFDNGDCFAFATSAHVMTVYGLNFDESGKPFDDASFYWTDNNNTNDNKPDYYLWDGTARDDGGTLMYVNGALGKEVLYLYSIHSTGIHFNDYDVRVNAEKRDSVFSHYCNVIIDDGQEFDLQYDLRQVDAKNPDCPVLGEVISYDTDGTITSRKTVTTGDVRLGSGTLNMVLFDDERNTVNKTSGGSVEGTIHYLGSQNDGKTRLVSVQYSGKIADTIDISTETGNILEVTGSNTASFGSLTGEGNLDKTGTGTAEVTQTVSLKGAVNVEEGRFVFGESATLGGETVLNVFSTGRVESKSGSSASLTLDAGIHTNDGAITLTTTVNTGATLKGSGTFAAVTVDGGTLIVGNSPGQQTYTGDLAVTLGDIVFSVDGWNAADGNNSGWGRGVYSNINMGNNDLTLGADSRICINLGNNALTELISGQEGNFSMDIVAGIDNVDVFNSALLDQLALQTHFFAAAEEGASTGALAAGSSLDSYLRNMQYSMNGGVLTLKGSYGTASSVPEPTTGTLSLLALAALCTRRRKK